tara:strand:+ start:1169 stop:2101 length:933 start_codon:yes stop_codon:yes gene_type:complete
MEKCQYLSVAGAGQKGSMYSGGICALQKHINILGIEYNDWKKQLKGVSGTSAGCFLCLQVLLGFGVNEIIQMVYHLCDVRQIMPCPNVGLLLESYGLENGRAFKNIVSHILSKSGLKETTTLGDLKNLLGKDVIFTATDLNTLSVFEMSNDKTPDMKVCDAIFISCCIPLLYTPVEYNGKLLTDGCLVCNQPMFFPADKTLFWLAKEPLGKTTVVNSFSSYVTSIINLPIHNQLPSNISFLKENNCSYVIFYGTEEIGELSSFDLKIDEQNITTMLRCGYYTILDVIFNNKVTQTVSNILQIFISVINET